MLQRKLSKPIEDYLRTFPQDREGTRHEYHSRLGQFDLFIQNEKKYQNMEHVLNGIKEGTLSAYDVVRDFYIYQGTKSNMLRTIMHRISTVRNFIESATDKPLSSKFLKNKLRVGRIERREKFALDRKIVIKILTAQSSQRLNTFLFFLAASGCRPIEALKLKVQNCYLQEDPPYVVFPAKITKTKRGRETFLTAELADRLKSWIDYKYRKRNRYNVNTQKTIEYTPERHRDDLLFSTREILVSPNGIYQELLHEFNNLLKTLDLDERYDGNNGRERHKISFKSFRDHAKSQISEEGHSDFSEYHIGHDTSTYWNRTKQDKIKTFRKIEPSITYLNQDMIATTTQDLRSQSEIQKTELVKLKQQNRYWFETLNRITDVVRNHLISKEGKEALQSLQTQLQNFQPN